MTYTFSQLYDLISKHSSFFPKLVSFPFWLDCYFLEGNDCPVHLWIPVPWHRVWHRERRINIIEKNDWLCVFHPSLMILCPILLPASWNENLQLLCDSLLLAWHSHSTLPLPVRFGHNSSLWVSFRSGFPFPWVLESHPNLCTSP